MFSAQETMNRIETLANSMESQTFAFDEPGPAGLGLLEGGKLASGQRETAACYFSPLHYEPKYGYPLLVWLHGAGEDETQLRHLMPSISLRNYVAVSVRGPLRLRLANGQYGYSWRRRPNSAALANERILSAIETAREKFHIHPGRIFLAGFGRGGSQAFRLALSAPELFAGVLSLSGRFPRGGAPLSRLNLSRQLPIFLATGRDSRKYPVEKACEDLRLMHAAGMEVSLRQYPCGHEIAARMLSDMDRWMMDRVAGSAI